MSKPRRKIVSRLVISLATGAVLIAGDAALAATEDAYTPTMKDMRSIQNALERYLKGFDTHDAKLQGTAFWDDAVIVEPTGGKITVKQMIAIASGGPMAAAPPPGASVPPPPEMAGPPPSGAPSGGPPGLPPGGMAAMTPPSCDAKAAKPAKGWELWHIVANDAFEFQSATRVRHHAYWFAVCPGAGPSNGAGLAVIGPPGHYDDILEKRNGEWRLISRVIALNEKYPKD